MHAIDVKDHRYTAPLLQAQSAPARSHRSHLPRLGRHGGRVAAASRDVVVTECSLSSAERACTRTSNQRGITRSPSRPRHCHTGPHSYTLARGRRVALLRRWGSGRVRHLLKQDNHAGRQSRICSVLFVRSRATTSPTAPPGRLLPSPQWGQPSRPAPWPGMNPSRIHTSDKISCNPIASNASFFTPSSFS